MHTRLAWVAAVVGLASLGAPGLGAQALGTFRWQLQPFCNVVTLNVRQDGAVYTLDGFDDQCGAATQASVVGTAFLNPDGSIGMGLNSALAPGAAPVVLYARLNLSTVSGTWSDSAGNSGTFAFTPGPGTGGAARPVPPNGIRPGSVTADQIAQGAIGATQIAIGSITAAQLALGSITGAQIAAGSITAQHLAPGAVQLPLAGTCPVGQYLRGMTPAGGLICEPGFWPTFSGDADTGGASPSIAIGTDGLPIISHSRNYTISSSLRVTKCGNPACTAGNVSTDVDAPVDGFVGGDSSIAIDSDGLPVISHHNWLSGALRVTRCGNAACTAGNVSADVDNPVTVTVGRFSSIAIGADGLPVISHHNQTLDVLRVTRCGNPTCTDANVSTDILDLPGAGRYTSVAIGANGLPVISHFNQAQGALSITACGNASCTLRVSFDVDDPGATVVGEFSSLAIGTDGLPVISYRNAGLNALRVTKCGAPDCAPGSNVSSNVDSPADSVGSHTSLAVSADGLPVISHHNSTLNALRVTKCSNPACTGFSVSTNVDDPGSVAVGFGTSIAIGVDGLPVIGHRNNGIGVLRVTRCGTPSCG